MIRRTATLAFTTVVLSFAFATSAWAGVSPPSSEVLPSSTPSSDVSGSGLVRTGSDVMPSVLLAIALCAVGVVLVVVARRRIRTQAIA